MSDEFNFELFKLGIVKHDETIQHINLYVMHISTKAN